MHQRNRSNSPPRRDFSMQDVAYCEGSSEPLKNDRTSELAMECWNLRKTVMEQSSQGIKIRNDLKLAKHLIKNLQALVAETQADVAAKTKELNDLKVKTLAVEKQSHEHATNENMLGANLKKYRQKVADLEKKAITEYNASKAVVTGHLETIERLNGELKESQDEKPVLIKQYTKEINHLKKENVDIRKESQEQAARTSAYEETIAALRAENEALRQRMQQESDAAAVKYQNMFDDLNSQLQISLTEKAMLRRIALEKDHTNNQLMGYILREGLMYPDIELLFPEEGGGI